MQLTVDRFLNSELPAAVQFYGLSVVEGHVPFGANGAAFAPMHATSHVKSAPCAHRSRIDVAVNLDVASGHHGERVFDVAFDRKTALHSKIAGMNIDRSLMHVVIHDIEQLPRLV